MPTKPGMTRQGVRDLNAKDWPKAITPPAPPAAAPAPADAEPAIVHDLLYGASTQMREAILAAFPSARLDLDHDWIGIHDDRYVVTIEGASLIEWNRFLLREGLAAVSLHFQLAMRTAGPGHEAVKAALDLEKPSWRNSP